MAENLPFVSSPYKLCFIIVVLCSSKGEPVFATLFCLRNCSFRSINKKYQKKVNEDEIMIESMTRSAEHKNHNSAFSSSVRITSLLNFFCMHIYTPDMRSMWGYIVFAFPFVRLFVPMFIRSCVRSSFRHKVKVFALKFIRLHILKTLWWISFIFGMMVDIGLKFLSALSPPRGWPWGQGHGLRIFIKKSKIFVFKFI